MRNVKKGFFNIWYYDELSDLNLKDIIMEYEKSYKFFEDFFHRKIHFELKLFIYGAT